MLEALLVVIVVYAALAVGAYVDRRRQLKHLEDWHADEGTSPWWL